MAQKVLVISGVSMKDGGIRSVLTDALTALDDYVANKDLKVYALVPDASDYTFSHIECIGFPEAKKSWWNRIRLEYFQFKKLSRTLQADYWLSLHDTSPRVVCKHQFMYAHNPTVFYKPRLSDWFFNYKIGLFALLYHWVYRFNIHQNSAVFVQQNQLFHYFKKRGVRNVVRCPLHETHLPAELPHLPKPLRKLFFYPLVPRSFKNVELLGEALKLLTPEENQQLEIRLTFEAKDGGYARYIAENYPLDNLVLIGKQSREQVFAHYQIMEALLFPSTLETWGLPISEAKALHKPLWVADLPYAKETVGTYENVVFFDPKNPKELAELFRRHLRGESVYTGNQAPPMEGTVVHNWPALFDYILEFDAEV